ncbi:MAG: YadA-like family protein [Proteobacteria bacterium]|nr:YadA-like family protein [Pseudomonadota bacterium]
MDSSTAVGAGASAQAQGSVAVGAGSITSTVKEVSFGSGSTTTDTNLNPSTRRLANVSDGENATDAATVGQLVDATKDLVTTTSANNETTIRLKANNLVFGTDGKVGKVVDSTINTYTTTTIDNKIRTKADRTTTNNMIAVNTDGSVTVRNYNDTAAAIIYTQGTTDSKLNGIVSVDKDNTGKATGTLTFNNVSGAAKGTVYTTTEADNMAQDKIDSTVGKAKTTGQAATGLFKGVADNAANIVTNTTDLATLKGSGDGSVAAAVRGEADARQAAIGTKAKGTGVYADINANTAAISNRKVTTDTTAGTATITDGSKTATVYTKGQTETLLGNKADTTTVNTQADYIKALQTTVGQAANDDNAATGLILSIGLNAKSIETLNKQLNVSDTRNAKLADGRNRKEGEAVASLHTSDTTQAEVTVSDSEVAITRGDGKVVFDADNDGGKVTRIRGGTATTIQTLRDQKDGNSGVLFQTTMYDADGNELTTANTPQRPTGATGTVTEDGVEKWVTDVRLGGVAAGVNANDAVNKGQLDTEAAERKTADAALGQRIDGNTQGVANVAAMASMPALPAGADSGFSAGVGGYNGKNAVAIGFQHRLSANTTIKVSAATGSNGKPTVGAGVNYAWGGSSYNVASQTVAMRDVTDMQNRLRTQEAQTEQANDRAAKAESEAMQAKAEAMQTKAALAIVMKRLEALEAKGAM